MGYKITDIEGIGPSYAEKLTAAKIVDTEGLLTACGTPKGRQAVAEATGISEKSLLNWTNMADLMRISGVAGQLAELLEAAGVDTVKELKGRNAENLAAKMLEVNAVKNLTKATISASKVGEWIDQAKSLDPRVSY